MINIRTFVFGDIHGCYEQLKSLIKFIVSDKNIDLKEDKFIFLGDYVDRGPDSYKVIQYIKGLQEKYGDNQVITLMGNHEKMMCNSIETGFHHLWYKNGGNMTVKSFEENNSTLESEYDWVKNLPLFYEDENFIYVHAGVRGNKKIIDQFEDDLLWIRNDFIFNREKYYKQIIFGHTPSILFYEVKPFMTLGGNIGIDTGVVFGGRLTCLIIENENISEIIQVPTASDAYIRHKDVKNTIVKIE